MRCRSNRRRAGEEQNRKNAGQEAGGNAKKRSEHCDPSEECQAGPRCDGSEQKRRTSNGTNGSTPAATVPREEARRMGQQTPQCAVRRTRSDPETTSLLGC